MTSSHHQPVLNINSNNITFECRIGESHYKITVLSTKKRKKKQHTHLVLIKAYERKHKFLQAPIVHTLACHHCSLVKYWNVDASTTIDSLRSINAIRIEFQLLCSLYKLKITSWEWIDSAKLHSPLLQQTPVHEWWILPIVWHWIKFKKLHSHIS